MAKSVSDQLAALERARENAEKALAKAKAEETQIIHSLRDKIVGVVREVVEAGIRENLAATPAMDTRREVVKAAAQRLFAELMTAKAKPGAAPAHGESAASSAAGTKSA